MRAKDSTFLFVRHGFENYFETDIREASLPVREPGEFEGKIISLQQDAANLSNFHTGQFDRIVATCLIAHLKDPPAALEEWKRVTAEGGALSIYLPGDPSLLLRVSQKLTTSRRVISKGWDYWAMQFEAHRYHFEYLKHCVE